MTPLVSVAIPAYGDTYLRQAIESVLCQRDVDFELIICDDGSPEDLEAVVAEYADERIRYFRNERNLGPEGNWNRCLALAKGKYFKLLPHDDTLLDDGLKTQVEVLEADEGQLVALVFGARQIIDDDGRLLMSRGGGLSYGMISAESLCRRCVRCGTNVIGEPGAVLMRTELARQVGLFDASIPYLIDLDFWMRALRFGCGFYLNEPVATFRVSTSSWSVAIGSDQSRQFRAFIWRLSDRCSIGKTDQAIGCVMSYANNLMRMFFYLWLLRR